MPTRAEIEAAILKRKEEAFERIRQQLWAGFHKKEAAKPKPKLKATVLDFPPKLSEQELIRRQQINDQAWERVLQERRRLERIAETSCHRGPDDSDWNL